MTLRLGLFGPIFDRFVELLEGLLRFMPYGQEQTQRIDRLETSFDMDRWIGLDLQGVLELSARLVRLSTFAFGSCQ